jgi:hypothetical protein
MFQSFSEAVKLIRILHIQVCERPGIQGFFDVGTTQHSPAVTVKNKLYCNIKSMPPDLMKFNFEML